MPETHSDFLFRGDLSELDPDVAELIRHETARQARYLIMIPSESTVPEAVREAIGSAFHNIYAEGYPLDETRTMTQAEILDYNTRLPEYRRVSDKRYYKGTEYADIVEALARRRAAELFATEKYPADKLFVNVQPLSGAPANSAIFTGLINLGDTIMGMDLLQGGHLTHGSPVARSGKFYKAMSYGVDPVTERLDYEAIRKLALEHRPKIIIAGYTSYPYTPDWQAFREIADEAGAYLMADVAHVAGMIIGGVFPNPVGIADVVSFTTHKTLAGPRGAVIITHRADVANKVDRAVFPGEQGGPHMHAIAGLAVSLRLAASQQFRELQQQTVKNAARLAARFEARGLRVAYGGTDTHMVLLDCKSVVGADGTPLSGDIAARVLDLAGIVANRNTIPGDPSALRASGVRLATPWLTQRGFREAEIDRLGDIIADLLQACSPFSYTGKKRPEPRAKVDFEVLERSKRAVRELAMNAGIDTDAEIDEYPHFYILPEETDALNWTTLEIHGAVAGLFLQYALTSDVLALADGQRQPTWVLKPDGSPVTHGFVERQGEAYRLHVARRPGYVATWLRGLSDGLVLVDPTDPYVKLPGPVDVRISGPTDTAPLGIDPKREPAADSGYAAKAYFVGINGGSYAGPKPPALPKFDWQEAESDTLKTTALHGLHQKLGAKMTAFAGYDMPVWYSSVMEEHLAVRSGAGLFDVTHMGVFDAQGPGAAQFLNVVTTNDVFTLGVGESHYTYLLDVDGVPHDDLMIYKLADAHFLIVVNASNNDKNWAWLNAVKNGEAQITTADPGRKVEGGDRFTLRDLRAETSGADQRLDVALQGPQSKAVLLALGGDDTDKAKVSGLPWAGVTRAILGGFDLIVSRTGYTGERIAYEIFVHPNDAVALFEKLIALGATPAGLAARDSLRTEAGLPLYGHELAGPLSLNAADAGFGSYVKLSKPFFVGKAAFALRERDRDSEVVRFRMDNKRSRPAHQGDPVLNAAGEQIGVVTSCSIDSERFQLGQAYLRHEASAEGAPIQVLAGAANGRQASPEAATILSRFPKKKKA